MVGLFTRARYGRAGGRRTWSASTRVLAAALLASSAGIAQAQAAPVAAAPRAATPDSAAQATAGSSAQAEPAAAAQPASPAQTGSEPRVQDIIVTAQRREENLQRIPISVTAITGERLAQANITSTAALQQVTPGLTWSTANRTALPYIRGVGSRDISVGSENSVAIYVDGIYIESSPAAMLALNNIERVEVLKGPQGTLFGRNATGGLIQIITTQPSQTPSGSLEVGYGNYRTATGSAYLTGPLTNTVSADLAVYYSNQDKGWGRNVFLNREVDTDETFSARGKVLLDLGLTSFTLGADYTHQKTDIGSERNLAPGRTGRPVNGVITRPLAGFYDTQSEQYPLGKLETGGVNLHAKHDFSFAKLISISSFRKTLFNSILDVDEGPTAVQSLVYNTRVTAFTQEVQLTSRGNGPFRWVAGAFYMARDGEQPLFAVVGSAVNFPPFLGSITTVDKVTSHVIAPYAQATVALGGTTELTGGIRYTIERQRFTGSSTGATGIVSGVANARSTYKKPTWRLAVNQRIGADLMAYLSYNRGFKSGVYNAASISDPPARPEVVDAYEIGFKSDLLDHRLRFNGALFQYNYTDIQLAVPTLTANRTINASSARIRGGEISVEAVPARGLTLTTGASLIPTAKYLSFPNAPYYLNLATGGNLQQSFDDSGGRMIRAPKLTLTVSAAYTTVLGAGHLDLGADVYHSSSFNWEVDRLVIQRPYEVVNGHMGYTLDSGLRVSVWGRNLLNRKYQSGVSETATASVYSPAPPRTYGLKLGYKF